MSAPAYVSLCPACVEKYRKVREMKPASAQFIGYCASPLCRAKTAVIQYEVGPKYDELERRRRRSLAEGKKRNNRASGERGRAERRANEHLR